MKTATSNPQEPIKNVPTVAPTKAPVAKRRADAPPTKAKRATKATRAKKATQTKMAARVRAGTKAAKIIDLLKRPGGVTLKILLKATGWQAHSVRGFLSGALGKKLRTPVESFKSDACPPSKPSTPPPPCHRARRRFFL